MSEEWQPASKGLASLGLFRQARVDRKWNECSVVTDASRCNCIQARFTLVTDCKCEAKVDCGWTLSWYQGPIARENDRSRAWLTIVMSSTSLLELWVQIYEEA